jgi:hypothetical protein
VDLMLYLQGIAARGAHYTTGECGCAQVECSEASTSAVTARAWPVLGGHRRNLGTHHRPVFDGYRIRSAFWKVCDKSQDQVFLPSGAGRTFCFALPHGLRHGLNSAAPLGGLIGP